MAKKQVKNAKGKARDKAYAMSEHGKKKKREAQAKRITYEKKHGKGSLKGKDYDHTKGKFVSVKKNRGNYGNGTRGMRA